MLPPLFKELTKIPSITKKADREGERPLEMSVKKLDKNGFSGKQDWRSSKFIAPCIFYAYSDPIMDEGNGVLYLHLKIKM